VNREQFASLEEGDIIRHKSGQGYVVMDNYRIVRNGYESAGVIVSRTFFASNHTEWDLIDRKPRT
jgi:hypothetical protein